MHALASPDGFAPSRDEFARAVRQATPPYRKFFRGYDDFIRSCGYRSATDRRREIAANQRAAQWQAQSEAQSTVQSTRHPIINSDPNSDPPHESPIASLPSAPSVPSVSSNPSRGTPAPSKPPIKPRPRTDELFYGDPIHCCDMAHAPVNEQGVVLLFGILAKKLGFRIEMVRTGYPDCEAKRKGKDGKWRRLRIEFEFVTSRFNHDPAGCDLIVCWEDDANPTNLEVLELKNHVGKEEPAPPVPLVPPVPAMSQLAAPSDQCVLSANTPQPRDPAQPSVIEPNAPAPAAPASNRSEPTGKQATRRTRPHKSPSAPNALNKRSRLKSSPATRASGNRARAKQSARSSP
ncbi:MAG: hypothetical protein KF691_07510 [Phycisphaeraceae bacterium]|nr:hypothetical protein [Phycisphaeraceae bacterium]